MYKKNFYIVVLVFSLFLVYKGIRVSAIEKKWDTLYQNVSNGNDYEWNNWVYNWQYVNDFKELEKYWEPVRLEWEKQYNIDVDWDTFYRIANVEGKTTIYSNDVIHRGLNDGANKIVAFNSGILFTFAYLLAIGSSLYYAMYHREETGRYPIIPMIIFCVLALPIGVILLFSKATGPGSSFAQSEKRRNYESAKNRYKFATEKYERAARNTDADYIKNYQANDMRSAKTDQADALADMINYKD